MEEAYFLGVAERGNRLAVQYMENEAYREEIVGSAEDAISFYNDLLKPEDHFEQFLVGSYTDDIVDDRSVRANGRGRDGKWYVDVAKLFKNTYLHTRIDSLDAVELEEVQQEQVADTLAEYGRSRALQHIRALIVDGTDTVEGLPQQIGQNIVATTLEELSHAFSEYAHPAVFEVDCTDAETRDDIEEVLSGLYTSYAPLDREKGDGLTYRVNPNELEQEGGNLSQRLNETLSTQQLDAIESWDYQGTIREPWEDVFFEHLAVYTMRSGSVHGTETEV